MSDIEPGAVLTGDSGAQYVIGEAIGLAPAGPCDAHLFGAHASIGFDGGCRCVVCARCGHHTGNGHQGHYWKHCKVLAARLPARNPGRQYSTAEWMQLTSRDDWHMCCDDPAFGCELESSSAVTP